MKTYYIYMLTNRGNRVIYIGVTNNLFRRVYEHKNGLTSGFTSKYNCSKLVYFEETGDVQIALNREKQLKKGSRQRKEELICGANPEWRDLAADWYRDEIASELRPSQ